jgi:dephospho-CoA kinase
VKTVILTGGLAAGKSTAAAHLRSRGVRVIDADAIGHRLLIPPSPVIAQVAEAFGPGVIASDGSVNRRALATVVFADDAARHRLEAITHPPIRRAMWAERAEAARAGERIVVLDIPLFTESGGRAGPWGPTVDEVLTVSAPEAVRLARAVEGRGMAPADARNRLAAQASDREREAAADIVLDGSAGPENLAAQLDRWLASHG